MNNRSILSHKSLSLNTCSNSYRGSSKKAQILKQVKDSEIELTPLQIALRTKFARSTVRGYLRILLAEGAIIQPYNGAYCSKIRYGMIVAPRRVHNLILSIDAPWLDFSDDVTEFTGSVKLRIQYGLQRHKVTARISCDAGMDRNSVCFALSRFYDLVKKRTNHVVDSVVVKTFEMNRDFEGVRLDGPQCYTKKGLFGVIERIYQKDNAVRTEQKVSQDMSVQSFEVLLRGGVTNYNVQQGLFALVQEVKALVDVVKFQNMKIFDLEKKMEAKE